jgi:hypothetical protein
MTTAANRLEKVRDQHREVTSRAKNTQQGMNGRVQEMDGGAIQYFPPLFTYGAAGDT